jgi:hypothetical protein
MVASRGRKMQIKPAMLLAFISALIPLCAALAADDNKGQENIVAAQVRAQGYQCAAPKAIKRDPEITLPGQIGWMLECEDAVYRVMLTPHKAAKIERVEQGGR